MYSRHRMLVFARGSFRYYGRRFTSKVVRPAPSSLCLPSTSVAPIRRHTTSSIDTSSPPEAIVDGTTEDVAPELLDDKTQKLQKAQRILDYHFGNEDLLWEALQAPGSNVTTIAGRPLVRGHKNIANVGDAVISLVVKQYNYGTGVPIGLSTASLARIASNQRLCTLCEVTELATCVNLNQSSLGIMSPQTCADTIEAIIGAVYFDGGIDAAKKVMRSLGVFDAYV